MVKLPTYNIDFETGLWTEKNVIMVENDANFYQFWKIEILVNNSTKCRVWRYMQ